MSITTVDPRRKPLRGLVAIGDAIGGQHYMKTKRQIDRGLIKAWLDGNVYVSTVEALEQSPLLTGDPPISLSA